MLPSKRNHSDRLNAKIDRFDLSCKDHGIDPPPPPIIIIDTVGFFRICNSNEIITYFETFTPQAYLQLSGVTWQTERFSMKIIHFTFYIDNILDEKTTFYPFSNSCERNILVEYIMHHFPQAFILTWSKLSRIWIKWYIFFVRSDLFVSKNRNLNSFDSWI